MQIREETSKENSIRQLRILLEQLTNELNKTTEHLQIIELQDNAEQHDNTSKSEISELVRKQNKISRDIITVKKRIQKLSARTILKAEIIVLPAIVILLAYMTLSYQVHASDQLSPIKSRYLIENLRGSNDDNYKYWNIIQNRPLTVNIINGDKISKDKLDAIKQAILSTDVVKISNTSHDNTDSGTSAYYRGWEGAVTSLDNTKYYVPHQFNIIESASGEGDIIVMLSQSEDTDGYSGYTRTVADDKQILKSFITIYNVDQLSANQVSTILRHEFGHALGLPHSNDPNDLMHATIQTDHPYVSYCDIHALQTLYEGHPTPSNFCNS